MNKVILGLGALILSTSVQAADVNRFTLGASVGMWTYEEQDVPDFKPYSFEVSGAYSINQFFDIYANAGLGVHSDSKSLQGIADASFKVNHYLGIYLKPHIDFNAFSVYALAGYASTSMEAEVLNQKEEVTDNGFAYGFGGSYALTESSSINVEWRQQVDEDAYELSGFTLGYSYTFN
ncbi:outer membrane beta-barrel protein [Shewanella marina]|uniref:outer membrane beta-barrel protein n=1 Tax=Shewanella marina TaxID=487319 RepID=UPI000471C21E|nr:outer membrane beta-barrel protein [Shewanella marina]